MSEIDGVAQELGMSRSGLIAEASARYVADVKNLSAEERRCKDLERARATFKRVGAALTSDDVEEMMDQLRKDRERGVPQGWPR